MNEDVNQPKQDDIEVSNSFPNASGPLSNQDLMLSADSPYEEPHVPYLPLPSESTRQTNPTSAVGSLRAAPPSSSLPANTVPTTPKIGGIGVLVGGILGALLGGVVGLSTGASPVMWGGIGAVVGGGIALLLYVVPEMDVSWLLAEGLCEGLAEVFTCCLTSAILVIVCVVTISGLLLWQNVLLAALAGGSIVTMLLIRVSCALLKHGLAKRRVSRNPLVYRISL